MALKEKGIAAEYLSSTQATHVKNKIHGDLDSGKPSVRLRYGAPDLVATKGFMLKLRKLHCRGLLYLIAIDEVHYWGLSFSLLVSLSPPSKSNVLWILRKVLLVLFLLRLDALRFRSLKILEMPLRRNMGKILYLLLLICVLASCGVNPMKSRWRIQAENHEGKIAEEFQVDWDTTETEQELLKPLEESIDGPRKFVRASSLPVNRAAINEPIDPTKAAPRSSSSTSINTHYHDTESAVEAATELAKQAVPAAQVASLLATRRDSTKEFSVSSDRSTNQKDSQYMDHHHHPPGSRRQSRDSETSSYYAKPSAENRGMGRRHSYNYPGINESDYTETEA